MGTTRDAIIKHIERVNNLATKVKELIKQNNERRKLLTEDNEKYYENVLVYIRSNFFRDERATEEVLLEMLDHLVEAQYEGKTAEEAFGKSPKELAEDIINSLPKESTKSVIEFCLELMLTLFGWYLVVWGVLPLIQQQNKIIYVGSVSVSALLLLIALILIGYFAIVYLRNRAFNDTKKGKSWIYSSLIALFFIAGISTPILVKPFGPAIEVTYYTGFSLGCFFLLAAYILKKIRTSK